MLNQQTKLRSYSLREWCTMRGISIAMFYKLQESGSAPTSYKVGAKRFISSEADKEWLQAREAENAA
jgi:predicted DNA-binding transcriptional regulator AlpA